MLKDRISHVKNELLFAETISSNKSPSNGVDLQGYSAATVVCSVGSMSNSGSSPLENWELTLYESDDDSSFNTVAESDMLLQYGLNDGSASSGVFATIDNNNSDLDDNINATVGYLGSKQYVKVDAVANNTPGSTPIAVSVVKEALQKPQDD